MPTTARDLSFDWRGLTLAGTLHLPPGDAPFPAVVMMQGSGPTDRDSGGYFPQIRDVFVGRGLAVYSFDKPGIGGSTGDWHDYALHDRADQARAALDIVAGQPEIDAGRVGVWGHSQGGWVVQIVASGRPDLPFAVVSAGPGIDVREQDRYSFEVMLRSLGLEDPHVERAVATLDAIHGAAMRGDDYAAVDRDLIAPLRGEPWYERLPEDERNLLDSAAMWGLTRRIIQEAYDPPSALERISCPLLAVFGSLDPLLPALESAGIYCASLARAGNHDATIVVFPGANHRMLVEETGELTGGYLDLLGDWVARRAGSLAVGSDV